MEYISEINNWIENNKDNILETLSELIQIKTENLPPTGNEKKGQEYLYNKTTKFIPEEDIDLFEIDDIDDIREHPLFFPTMDDLTKNYKDRPNLVARLKGTGGGKSIVFSGHMDTIPVGKDKWIIFGDPFSGKIKDGKMYGRGSADMKAGTLAGFFAIKCIKDLGIKLHGDVYAESVVDEENGGVNGTIAARLRNQNIDFAILSEPTDLIVGIETIGGSDWKATVIEKSPGGIDANIELPNPIYKLSKIVLALEKYDRTILKKVKKPSTYGEDMNLRLLTYQFYSGGSNYLESGAVPTRGHIYFWLETFAYMKEENVRKSFINFMKKELEKYDDFKDNFPKFKTVIRFMSGHKTDINHPAMSSIRKSYSLLGLKYIEKGLPLAMDAYAFKKISNTDIIVIGPVGENLHGIDENVDIKSIFTLIKIMILTALDYCA